ncbi:nuclear transport factor 2 [Lophium mytilinum]|uniref:Nuclear transport factor 2 n=1 Tax=Lophium mytilinum TaxID=390894 RepID=A0A6A6R7M3_9PEZI|nr:nuclear transport factor 2 [Lophium mytilinum]
MAGAVDFTSIAQQFVKFYYEQFDTNRGNLGALYRPHSMLTFEANPSQGVDAILEKLQSLPFTSVQHRTDTLDAQPSSEDGGILVLVTGALLVEGSERPMSFTQTFQLRPDAGTFYVFNDVFRLVYPAA